MASTALWGRQSCLQPALSRPGRLKSVRSQDPESLHTEFFREFDPEVFD
jgi:hypothetical protein